MANCFICAGVVETHNYLRAKAMAPVETVSGRTVFKSAPNDEHLFFGINAPQYRYRNPDEAAAMCQGHSPDLIAARIEEALQPSEGQPVRLLFNPNDRHPQLALRRQRAARALDDKYGPAAQSPDDRALRRLMIQYQIDAEDKRQSVEVQRRPGESDGLRFINVQDARGLRRAIGALQGEPEMVGG